MKSKENLVFLGMMGSGKSSIGFLVAKKLNLNFVDIDKEIEKDLNTSIKKIFLFNDFKIFIWNNFFNFFFRSGKINCT